MAGRLRKVGQRLKAKFVPGTVILLYHRIAEIPSDPQLLSVTPEHFKEHLEFVRREFHPMALGAFVRALANRSVPERVAIITFDDGYADNLHQAKPLLEQFEIPATVFVTTGYVGGPREFWWDDLDRVFLQPGTLPQMLSLSVDGMKVKYELGNSSQYDRDRFERHMTWNVERDQDPTQRHVIYRSLIRLLRPLPERRRRDLLEQILSWAGAEIEGRAPYLALAADELLRLVDGGLIEVGAHSMTHPILAALSEGEQTIEIEESKRRLENIIGSEICHFAYPFGSPADYTQKTAAIVEQVGFWTACANYPGVVWSGRNRYQWPRILVRDWDGEELGCQLRRWGVG